MRPVTGTGAGGRRATTVLLPVASIASANRGGDDSNLTDHEDDEEFIQSEVPEPRVTKVGQQRPLQRR